MKYDYTIQELLNLLTRRDEEYFRLKRRDRIVLKYGSKSVEFTVLHNETTLRSMLEDNNKSFPPCALVFCALNYANLTIRKEIPWNNWIFAENLIFSEVTFQAPVSCKNAVFLGKVSFYKSKFKQTVDFNKCKFFQDISFPETEFHNDALFNGITCYKNSNFQLSYFAGKTSFQESSFSGSTDFSDSIFEKHSFFGTITFKSDLSFHNCVFNDAINLNGTNFNSDANFSSVHFKNEVLINWFSFDREVLFNNCQFDLQVNINDGFFKGKCSFSDVVFSHPLTVSGVVFLQQADFSGAQFNHNAYFVNVQFSNNTYFSSVTFDGPGQIFFDDSIFKEDAFFLGSYFNKEVLFLKSEFCRRTDFTQLNIGAQGRMNIIECLFNSIVDFSDFEEISGKIYIDKSDFIRKCLLNFDVLRGENKKFDPLVISNDQTNTIDYRSTYKNFLSFREIFFRNNDLDKELELLYQAKVYKRKNIYQWNKNRSIGYNAANKVVQFFNYLFMDVISKYFTSWERVLISIALSVVLFSLIYCMAPLLYNLGFTAIGTIKGINTNFTGPGTILTFIGDMVYFSLITFTTIGYGELLPTGLLRYVAGFEGFTGITLTSLFLVSLAKRVIG